MIAIMCGRRFMPAAALTSAVFVATLAAAHHAGAEPRRLRVGAAALQPEQTPGQPANENVDPAELGRLFDAYTVMQAQEALGLDEARFGPFVTRLRALQELRRRNLRERAAVMRDLRQLLQTPGNDVQIKDRLDALAKLEATTRADQARAMEAIDELLAVRQRARFRPLEHQLELRKLELVNRARQRQRANRP